MYFFDLGDIIGLKLSYLGHLENMGNKRSFIVVADIAGTEKCFEGPYYKEEAKEAVERLDFQTHVIPEGRTVPVFRIANLKPGEMLWSDGQYRTSDEKGEIALSRFWRRRESE